MENKKYKIPPENSSSALLFTMIEVYAQNAVIMDVAAALLSMQSAAPIEKVKESYNKLYRQKKEEIMDTLYGQYGKLDTTDILPDDDL